MPKLAVSGGRPVFDSDHRWPTWPTIHDQDERRLLEVYRSGAWGLGASVTAEFASRLASALGVKHVLPVNSGTAALELAVKACGIGPGDEVIVPAFTFVASATCALAAEATVVFADIDPGTLNLSPQTVAPLITARTRAVICVHFAGNPCDMEGLRCLVKGTNIALIEDAAHAHGMLYRGLPAGKHGKAACFSYQSSKNMNSGEGGALVTDDTGLFELAESLHSFGRLPGRPWYEHHHLSSNQRITGFQSAVLLGQLDRLEAQTQHRFENGRLLNEALAQLPGQHPQAMTDASADTRRAFHIYIWRHDAAVTGISREAMLRSLRAEGVPVSSGYPAPMQANPMFVERRFWHRQLAGSPPLPGEPDYRHVQTPVTQQVCSDSIWLSQSLLLASRGDIQRIVEAVAKVLESAEEQADLAPQAALT